MSELFLPLEGITELSVGAWLAAFRNDSAAKVTVEVLLVNWNLSFMKGLKRCGKFIEIGDDYPIIVAPSELVQTGFEVKSIKSIAEWQQPIE